MEIIQLDSTFRPQLSAKLCIFHIVGAAISYSRTRNYSISILTRLLQRLSMRDSVGMNFYKDCDVVHDLELDQ